MGNHMVCPTKMVGFNEKSYENQSVMLFYFMKNPMKTYLNP